jgi:hypothetical protein
MLVVLWFRRWLLSVSAAGNKRFWCILGRCGASCDSGRRVVTKAKSETGPPVRILYGHEGTLVRRRDQLALLAPA